MFTDSVTVRMSGSGIIGAGFGDSDAAGGFVVTTARGVVAGSGFAGGKLLSVITVAGGATSTDAMGSTGFGSSTAFGAGLSSVAERLAALLESMPAAGVGLSAAALDSGGTASEAIVDSTTFGSSTAFGANFSTFADGVIGWFDLGVEVGGPSTGGAKTNGGCFGSGTIAGTSSIWEDGECFSPCRKTPNTASAADTVGEVRPAVAALSCRPMGRAGCLEAR